ncbi:MAG: methyltransferase [Porphyromonas sp.]|nr:methyltransferase [Porphyromonas sp.]
MKGEPFRLKQFEVQQQRSALKVGTDGMLLGAYMAERLQSAAPHRILDVGAGTGIIALMLAQALPASAVTGIEMDPPGADEARDNAARSPFSKQVNIIQGNYLDHTDRPYDAIISNPPYYTATHSNADPRQTHAKHAVTLTPRQFFQKSGELLTPDGAIAIITATTALPAFQEAAAEHHFVAEEILYIHTKTNKPPKRAITIWRPPTATPSEAGAVKHLTILRGDNPHDYTPQYSRLLSPYLIIL